MSAVRSLVPDVQTLTRGLTSVFYAHEFSDAQVTVLDREPIGGGTFANEIVRCQVPDGRQLHLVCKYGSHHKDHVYGHRGGVPYEADVYRHVLQPLRAATPPFYGARTDTTSGDTWLIIGYVDQSVRLHHAPESLAAMSQAARWIGQFHALTEARLSTTSMRGLRVYETAYYLGWVRRTLQFAGHLHHRFPWLATLGARAEEFAALLTETPLCIIHGEYYPKNVLYRDGIIYPVDWESAAIAAGEIDLVSLTDRWSRSIVRQCELEYQRARWPHGAPASFAQRLAAAQLYMHFRWLGDRPEWTTHKNYLWRFEHLRSVGEQWGLI